MATLFWRPAAGTAIPAEAAVSPDLSRLLKATPGVLAGLVLLALLWPILPLKAAPAGLFFSEYMAGPGAALEIFNGTGVPVDLALDGYQVQFFFDGAVEASVTIELTGSVAAGETYVLVPQTAAPSVLAAADQICEQPFFDGNDVIVLRQQETIIDAIGQIGFNPGEAWGSEPVTTRGVILRRKAVITTGDVNDTDPFEPALEWEPWPLDELAGLGAHTLAASPPLMPTEPIVEPTPLPVFTPSPVNTISLLITPTTPVSPAGEIVPPAAVPPPALPVLIGEFLYAGLIPSTEGDEFVELCNPNGETIDLAGYKIGDEAARGGGESMYQLRAGTELAADSCLLIAKNAHQFHARFGFWPDFELVTEGEGYIENLLVLNLDQDLTWSSGDWALANEGDELLVLGPGDELIDSVAYGNADYASLTLAPGASARAPYSLHRLWPGDTNSMAYDFVRALPSPGSLAAFPLSPAAPLPAALPEGMLAFWGHLHAHSSYTDGAGPPFYALALARAAGLHFYAITDSGSLLDAPEWLATLDQTRQATVPGAFVGLRGVEWRHDTAGHVTVFNSDTLLSPTDPLLDSLPELYAHLAADPAALAQFNHPGRVDFDNFAFDPAVSSRLVIQEISRDIGGEYTRFETAFLTSNQRGWRVAPTASGDAVAADWGLGTTVRTGLVAPALTEQDLLNAIRARRLFATEDANLALALRIGGAWMGAVLTRTGTVPVTVDIVDPDPEPATLFFYQGSRLLATVPLASSSGQWVSSVTAWPGQFFWLRLVQADGQVAYTAPIWVEGQAPPDVVYLNEFLPAPRDRDWNGDGVADSQDEWIELFNPTDHPIDLNGWQVSDTAATTFTFPPGTAIPAGGFVAFYRSQTGLALNNDRDSLTLTNPIAVPVDSFGYGASPGYNGSWCRLPDGGSGWSDNCEPSPGASNREKAPSGGPLTTNIYEAKRLTPGALVRIKGRVTAPPGILGARYMYIQDSTAGILIYLPKDHRLYFNLGDRVQVQGKLRLFHQEFEIAVEERDEVSFLEPGLPPPPLPIATTSLLEPYEGLLVMLTGQVARFSGQANLWLDDGTGEARVYIKDSTGIARPWLSPDTPATVIGIVSQYSEDEPSRADYRLLPRYQSDLLVAASPLPPSGWPTTLPETGAAPNDGPRP